MPKISSLFNSVTELLPSRASLGVHGPSAIIHTCKIALFALLLGQGCRFSKASLRSGDAIYPDRCRVRIPETHPAFQVDLSTPMDGSPVVADRALAVTDTAKVKLREAFVYYNPTSGKYAAGKMDTTSLEHAVACLGVKPEGFLTCDDAKQLLDKFGPEDVQNLQNTPPFGENVYRSFSTPRGAPSSGKIVWSEMSWMSAPGPDDPLPEEMDVLQSYLKIPDTLYEEPLTLTVQRGIDIKDSTQSATYVSLVDMNPSTSDSVSLSPLNRIILATVPLDASASQASSTAEAMKWGLIPPHISIEPLDTSKAEVDRAYRAAYDEAGYYRESNQSRWLADLGRQIDATRRSYDIYDATCPGSLNSWRMFGFGSADDMMYNALQARTDLENATWTDLPDTSVSDSTSTTPENCFGVHRMGSGSFEMTSTCTEDVVFSVVISGASGTPVRSDYNVQVGEQVDFRAALSGLGASSGTYYVTVASIQGPTYMESFAVIY